MIPAFLVLAALALYWAWHVDRRAWKLERDGSNNERMQRVQAEAEPEIPRMELRRKFEKEHYEG